MTWQINNFGTFSSLSSKKFSNDDKVISLVAKDSKLDELLRYDFFEDEYANWAPSSSLVVIGRWTHLYKDINLGDLTLNEKKESAESFFLSLFEKTSKELEERNLLIYLFALSLERKRILKSEKYNKNSTFQTYIHTKLKQKFKVPIVNSDEIKIDNVKSIVGELLI